MRWRSNPTFIRKGGCCNKRTDRAEKRVTQIVYFNEPWRPEWGGSLRIKQFRDWANRGQREPGRQSQTANRRPTSGPTRVCSTRLDRTGMMTGR